MTDDPKVLGPDGLPSPSVGEEVVDANVKVEVMISEDGSTVALCTNIPVTQLSLPISGGLQIAYRLLGACLEAAWIHQNGGRPTGPESTEPTEPQLKISAGGDED